jgi:hypothetical protein
MLSSSCLITQPIDHLVMASPPIPPPAVDSSLSDFATIASQISPLIAQHLAPRIEALIAAEMRNHSDKLVQLEEILLVMNDVRLEDAKKEKERQKRAEEEAKHAEREREEENLRSTVPFGKDDVEVGVETGVNVGGRKTASTYRSGGP